MSIIFLCSLCQVLLSELFGHIKMNWEAEQFINLLPLNSKSILLCLLCEKRDGQVNISFSPADTMLSLVSRGCWRDTGRVRDFSFCMQCELSPVLSMVALPAPCSCRTWQPAGPGSQQLPWVPPGGFIVECCC